MFTARVFKLMIRSVGNIMEENFTATRVIEEWNANYSADTGKVFVPINCKKEPIDLQEIDIVVGIIGSFICDAEFFKEAVKADKKVLLFFNTSYDANNSMISEVQEVDAFRKQMESHCVCESYRGINEFINTFKVNMDSV